MRKTDRLDTLIEDSNHQPSTPKRFENQFSIYINRTKRRKMMGISGFGVNIPSARLVDDCEDPDRGVDNKAHC